MDSAGDLFVADSGNNRVVELQTHFVSFWRAQMSARPERTTPAPCSQTLTLNLQCQRRRTTLGEPRRLRPAA